MISYSTDFGIITRSDSSAIIAFLSLLFLKQQHLQHAQTPQIKQRRRASPTTILGIRIFAKSTPLERLEVPSEEEFALEFESVNRGDNYREESFTLELII